MRVILPEILIVGFLLMGIGVVLLVGSAIRWLERGARPRMSREDRLITRNRARFQRQRLRRARRTTPWKYYSRPAAQGFAHEVGIERVWNGHVLDRKHLGFVDDEDIAGRLDLEGQAILAAQEHNQGRTGMDDGGTP